MINTMPLFYIINAGILGYFLMYLIKRYLIPALIVQKNEEALTVERLEKQYLKVKEEYHHLQQQINAQKIVYHHLEQHITQWKLKIEEERAQHMVRQQAFQEKLHQKRLIQQKQFNQQKQYNHLLPHVIEHAKQELAKKVDAQQGRQYIEEIIAGLR